MSELISGTVTALVSGAACTLLLRVHQARRDRRRDARQDERQPLVDEGLALGNADQLTHRQPS